MKGEILLETKHLKFTTDKIETNRENFEIIFEDRSF